MEDLNKDKAAPDETAEKETEEMNEAAAAAEDAQADTAGAQSEASDDDIIDAVEVEVVDEQEQTTEKKGFFGKKKKDKKDAQIEELTDRVRRQMAEFDNFRKRTEKEKAGMYDLGVKSTVEKILPVVDNFERGLAAVTDPEDAFAQGMQKIYQQLTDMLDAIGVKPIEAVGQPFDSNLHNAVMHVEDENLGENVVAEEFQKGYIYHDTVIRHSMVKVAN